MIGDRTPAPFPRYHAQSVGRRNTSRHIAIRREEQYILECEKTMITRKQFIHWPKPNETFESKKVKNNVRNDLMLLHE